MWSQTADYALRAVMCLAADSPLRLTTPQVAARTGIPAGYLAKVLQLLTRAGLVASHRGYGGGFALAIAPADLTLLAVVEAVTPLDLPATCPFPTTAATVRCALYRRLAELTALVEQLLRTTTVASLLAADRTLVDPTLSDLCRHCACPAAEAPAPVPEP